MPLQAVFHFPISSYHIHNAPSCARTRNSTTARGTVGGTRVSTQLDPLGRRRIPTFKSACQSVGARGEDRPDPVGKSLSPYSRSSTKIVRLAESEDCPHRRTRAHLQAEKPLPSDSPRNKASLGEAARTKSIPPLSRNRSLVRTASPLRFQRTGAGTV